MPGTPTHAELLAMAQEARLADFHVALPGKVESYDAAKQVANVRPMVHRLVPAPDGESEVVEELPVIQAVPVVWPRGGGFFIHLPLAAGDEGLLVFSEADPSGWRRTSEADAPPDHRRNHLAHAVFLPGYASKPKAIPSPSSTKLTVGKEGGLMVTMTPAQLEVGGSTDAAALASKLDSFIQTFVNWVVVAQDGGAALKTLITAWVAAHPGTTGSTKLKVGG